jgi:hypothetical protein
MSVASAETIYTVMEDFELSYVEKDKENIRIYQKLNGRGHYF